MKISQLSYLDCGKCAQQCANLMWTKSGLSANGMHQCWCLSQSLEILSVDRLYLHVGKSDSFMWIDAVVVAELLNEAVMKETRTVQTTKLGFKLH